MKLSETYQTFLFLTTINELLLRPITDINKIDVLLRFKVANIYFERNMIMHNCQTSAEKRQPPCFRDDISWLFCFIKFEKQVKA